MSPSKEITSDCIAVTCQPSGQVIWQKPDRLLSEDAAQQGFRLLKGCRNGVCEYCEGTVLQGQLSYRGRGQEQIAGPGEYFLFCTAQALTGAEVSLPRVLAPGEYRVKTLACQIKSVELLGTSDVYKVELLAPAGETLDYDAGQYLEIILPEGSRNAFSIANRPDGRRIELHIQYLPDRDNCRTLLQTLQQQTMINAELPKGNCILKDTGTDKAFFVAAGTGFTQMKALLEEAFEQGSNQQLYLYWGARRLQDLYMAELPQLWDQEYENFHFVPVIGDLLPDQEWNGHVGMLHDAMIKDHGKFDDATVYASGSPNMVYSVTDTLIQYGLDETCVFSDVFSYAPRK
ncbi:2Fe-2S iron-sulfur cluster-binding protein [Oceanospirillum sediminis]|uniref:2', 3'-cyclic nucleotide 2'-phosphodiesterase n=1 Tax=Oceanospirillum sediminis TaxID=2760088 RepID=A0A839INW7_9GAMM|nr:2Fe-2S iron-sulfur cluster-binding protein [Oceanospirillum sediminis]MBB1486591.1 2', 3'-cyclic nucleotide 2'-phosphodiesterase [Oceanospirillum sediminis]